jgi:hypothetical protein
LIEIDHLVVTADTLAAGDGHVAAALGHRPGPGGRHARMGTHNRLLSLGPGAYLEVIAIDPEAPPPGSRRWFGLDGRTGPPALSAWVARTDDLDRLLALAPGGWTAPFDMARGPYAWRFAMPVAEQAHLPPVIEWRGRHPAPDLPDAGCRLTQLEIAHPQPAALAAALPRLVDDEAVRLSAGPPRIEARIATPGGSRVLR